MRILVTNDDGIHAPGLGVAESIARALSDDVWVVAPENEQSGASHSLTLASPLRLRKVGERRFAVSGTPTDCVMMACLSILEHEPPTLVLSVLRYKVPPKASAHMVYLTEAIDAANAREWGIVAEVVPGASLRERADAMVASICSRERIAVAALKTYFREVTIPDFSLASEVAGAALANAMTSMRR